MFKPRRSVLLKTSTKNSVQYSGGKLAIAGLEPVKTADIISMFQIKSKVEVPQVVTFDGAGTWVPVANTRYSVRVGQVNSTKEGWDKRGKSYSFTTPSDLTLLGATPALQREYIIGKIVAQINDDTTSYATAASTLLGTGFTITDDAGYFPARMNQGINTGRKGANYVYIEKAGGFDQSLLTVTTSAVYAFGIGSRMVQDIPVIFFMGGNLASGELDAPKTIGGEFAVSGQKYDAFSISSLQPSTIPTVTNVQGYVQFDQVVFVDNGTGTSTANATGFAAFERAMQRALFAAYSNDPQSIVEFFDAAPITGSKLGGIATGATGDQNTLHLSGGNVMHYAILGTGQTLVAPAYTATGLQLDLDAADNEGAEYSAPVDAISAKEFVVGVDEFSLIVKGTIADVSDTDDCAFGFRKKEAYQAAIDSYDEMVVLNVISGDIKIETILNNAATATTDTTLNWADTEEHELEIRVSLDGSVKFLVDSVDVTDVQTASFSFDAGEVVIPFGYVLNAAASAPTVVLSKFVAVPTVNYKN